ncbi:LysR family transcriptional regulator [Flexivirga sp. ID2601S]|uniref:LysR family transcriptional regulator n=1 Tax=Flexivirga aerilata TaxID=1656889 RepID=A0A849AAX5_9MICO|nr:LysR family transcriptional regulator [Flexivirga aerilata]NNG37675.1 LysR family transcriptional regulator [Flexivirga aerilata]
MLELRRLQALVAVAHTGSVSAAADELRYGQPTISHHLRRLEAETQTVLLQRVGRGVRLTAEGEALAHRAEEILALAQRAEDELQQAAGLRAGRVRLAAFPSATATLVPPMLRLLGERAPAVAIELIEAEPPDAAAMLRAGDVDLALTFTYADEDADLLSAMTVAVDHLYLVEPGTERERRPDRALRAHTGTRWVAGCERCRAQLVDLCAAAGFEPEVTFATDDYVAVQALVAQGSLVSILPGLALAAHRHPGVRVTRLPATRRVQVVSYGAPPRPRAVDAVAAALEDTARMLPTPVGV